jgi:hypothetical protein
VAPPKTTTERIAEVIERLCLVDPQKPREDAQQSRAGRERDDIGALAGQPAGVSLHHRPPRLDRRLSSISALDRPNCVAECRLREIAIDPQTVAAGVADDRSL